MIILERDWVERDEIERERELELGGKRDRENKEMISERGR
jgi:hypothetical protein